MKIIVDYNDLNKKGDVLIENAENLKTYINQMLNRIDKFNESWSGKDSIEFQKNIKENHIDSFLKLQEILLSYGKYLKSASKAYQNLDEIFTSKKINISSR